MAKFEGFTFGKRQGRLQTLPRVFQYRGVIGKQVAGLAFWDRV